MSEWDENSFIGFGSTTKNCKNFKCEIGEKRFWIRIFDFFALIWEINSNVHTLKFKVWVDIYVGKYFQVAEVSLKYSERK